MKRRWVPRSSCKRRELDVGGSRGRGSGASCMGGPSSSIFTLRIRLCVTSSCQSFPKSQQSYSSGHPREEAKWTCKSSSIRMCSSPSCESGSGSSSCWTRTGSCKQRPGNSSPVAMLLNLGENLKGENQNKKVKVEKVEVKIVNSSLGTRPPSQCC